MTSIIQIAVMHFEVEVRSAMATVKEVWSASTNISDQIQVTKSTPVDLLLDGEPTQTEVPFTICLRRKGVHVLVA